LSVLRNFCHCDLQFLPCFCPCEEGQIQVCKKNRRDKASGFAFSRIKVTLQETLLVSALEAVLNDHLGKPPVLFRSECTSDRGSAQPPQIQSSYSGQSHWNRQLTPIRSSTKLRSCLCIPNGLIGSLTKEAVQHFCMKSCEKEESPLNRPSTGMQIMSETMGLCSPL